MTVQTKVTYCRICEALCGLEVDVEDERVLDVRPDPKHPVSKGFACVKGVGLGGLHHDPDRLNHPLKREGDEFVRISWEQATREIGAELAALRKVHGARSLAVYTGNPTFFNYKSFFFVDQFVAALGTPNLFASHSIDCNNKFDVAQRMYGLPTIHPVVDLARVRFLMILGSNPAASQMSFIQAPNAVQRLKQIVRRGGRVIVVDPRRSETAQQVGEHQPIKPGTDVYLLLAMLHVVLREKLHVASRLSTFVRGFMELEQAVLPFTPERAEKVTAIAAQTIVDLARSFAKADGAALYMSTGVNMGPFGSVAYWILQCLNLLTGNVDREGGLLQPKGPFDLLALTNALGVGRHGRKTRDGRFHGVVDALPAGALADEIETPGHDRVRALIVTSGNPVHSIPGGRMARALGALDLLVSVDIYPNETSRHAHYVLPATDMLERSDYPITTSLNQETPCAQFTEPVLAPAFERREEWRIFSDIARAASAPWWRPTLCHVFGGTNALLSRLGLSSRLDPDTLLSLLFGTFGDLSLATLRAHPHGMLLPAAAPGSFLGKRVYTKDKRVDLAPAGLITDLTRVAAMETSFTARPRGLVMIGRREKRSHNSWMHNHLGLQQPRSPALLMHPADAQLRNIASGSMVRLSGNGSSFEVPVEVTENVQAGVVALPHGWGHADSGLTRAQTLGGGNVNALLPGGLSQLEPVSGQAIMLGHTIEVQAVSAAEHDAALLP
jgi:formate dehydrogenase